VHRATGGNPLAVIALIAEPDRLREVTPGVPMPVPARIAAWFARRAAGLDPDTHRVLLVAAAGDGDLAAGGPGLRGRSASTSAGWPRPSGPGW
jgi:hypothetical protein